MSPRRSLGLPITLAVVMIVILVALTVGWVLVAVYGALLQSRFAGLYWTFLLVGTTFFVLLLVGVVFYLTLSIKAINLNRRQSNFIDSVTHELKSPIASLKLYLQTLHRHDVSEQKKSNFYRFMLDDVERLDHLINQILDAGKLDKKAQPEEIDPLDLGALLSECAETVCMRYRVSPKTVTLDLEPCIVQARRIDLEMIFRNLIDNAVKYAGNSPQVEVHLTARNDNQVIVRISDNGQGIPPKLRRKIFRRFERLGLEIEREKPGTGLGLFIVRTLVRRLRGRVKVHDREPSPGTMFEVQIPGRRAEATDLQKNTSISGESHVA